MTAVMDGDDAGQGDIGAGVVGPLAVSHRLAEEGARLRAAGPDAVDAVFESSFRALSADELGQLGGLLDAVLAPIRRHGESQSGIACR